MSDEKKILLVDDDPDFVDAVKSIVEGAGYAVDVAYDGKEALEILPASNPDIIILDVMMPEVNGHEACKRIKADPQFSHVPIILLTAVSSRVTSSTYTHRDMLESEAEDYIPKPVEPEVLLARIKDWL
ncbi:MAG: response regulator [Deltaproteobacteria bacterium]|nr:response regulator [Deltaproteobacteria bacterium]